MYDVVIIGAGPAGLTAGLYAVRNGLKTVILEKVSAGGYMMLTDFIENYPGFPSGIKGYELADRMKEQAVKFGVEIREGEVEAVIKGGRWKVEGGSYVVKTTDKEYETLGVIIATGAEAKKLGVPGEERLRGKGVSYCATCDGPLFKEKIVSVIGGGDTAVEEGIFLTRFAKKVFIVHRRDKLRASQIIQERAFLNSKIEFVFNSILLEISGDNLVEGLKVKDVKTEAIRDIPCEGVFIFVGLVPNTQFLKGLIDMDESGYIIVDSNNMSTSLEGLYACGDCIKKSFRQVVNACGEGAVAALSVEKFIEEKKGT